MAKPRAEVRQVPVDTDTRGDFSAEERAELSEASRRDEAERAARAEMLAAMDEGEDGEFFKAVEEIEQAEGVNFIISRVRPHDKAGYMGKLPASEMNLENLRKLYGPGRYRIRAQGPHGFVQGGGTVTIAESLIPPPVATVASDKSNTSMDFFQLQQMHDQRMFQRMTQMLTLLTPIITAYFANRQQGPDLASLITALKPPGMAEMTTMLSNLKQLSGGESKSELDTFFRAMEFAKEMNSTDHKTEWLDVVKEVAGPLLGKISPSSLPPPMRMPPRVLPSPQPTAVVQPQPQVQAQPQPEQTQENMNVLQWLQWMREQLIGLIAQASRNRDPVLYANVMVDNIPEDDSGNKLFPPEKLLEFIERSDWWEMLVKFESGVTPHKEWFLEFRKELVDILKNPEGESDGN